MVVILKLKCRHRNSSLILNRELLLRNIIQTCFVLINILVVNISFAQELSFREQVDVYCQAHNPDNLTADERKLAEKYELWQVIDMRVSKASQQPDLKDLLHKALAESSNMKEFFNRFHKDVTNKLGEWWLCPYMTYKFEKEVIVNEILYKKGIRTISLPMPSLEFFNADNAKAGQVIISIDKNNNVYIGDDKLVSTDVEIISKGMDSRATDINTKIVINTDGEASAQMVLNVIMAAKKSGFKQISFVVQ